MLDFCVLVLVVSSTSEFKALPIHSLLGTGNNRKLSHIQTDILWNSLYTKAVYLSFDREIAYTI